MGTAIKHPVPDWVKPSFIIVDIQAAGASECPDVKNYDCLTRSAQNVFIASCTHMATVGVKGLKACCLWIQWPHMASKPI